MTEDTCPICKATARIEAVLGRDPRETLVECKRCGFFLVPRHLLGLFREMEDRKLLPYLSAHIRQNSSFQHPFSLDAKNWEELAKIHKATPVPQKINRLLSLIAQRTDPPGSRIELFDHDPPLIDAANPEELVYLLKEIHELGFIELQLTGDHCRCIMKANGWEWVQEQMLGGIRGRCFVAMSFDKDLEEAYEKGILPALKIDCKLDPMRVDKVYHDEKICNKIIAEIRLSQFVVADFTKHKPNVYFEAGFALGLGRPVMWSCRKDDFTKEKAQFDTRQYPHIVWTTPEDLRDKLRDRVIAMIPEKD